MGQPKPIDALDPRIDPLTDTDLFPVRKALTAPAQKTTMTELITYVASKLAGINGLTAETIAGILTFRLGQPIGEFGDPGKLLENTEIPFNNFRLFFGKDDGVSPVIAFDVDGGQVLISNNVIPGGSYAIFDGDNWAMETFGDGILHIGPEGNAVIQLNMDISLDNGNGQWYTNAAINPRGGLMQFARSVNHAASPFNADRGHYFYNVDTSAGDVILSLDPVQLDQRTIVVKKTTSDANNVELLPSSGTIQELGAPVASISYNTQGQSKTIYCDGTNFFII